MSDNTPKSSVGPRFWLIALMSTCESDRNQIMVYLRASLNASASAMQADETYDCLDEPLLISMP